MTGWDDSQFTNRPVSLSEDTKLDFNGFIYFQTNTLVSYHIKKSQITGGYITCLSSSEGGIKDVHPIIPIYFIDSIDVLLSTSYLLWAGRGSNSHTFRCKRSAKPV